MDTPPNGAPCCPVDRRLGRLNAHAVPRHLCLDCSRTSRADLPAGGLRLHTIGGLALIGLLFAPWFLVYGFNQRLNDQGIQASLPSNWATIEALRHKFFGGQWALMIGLLLFGIVSYQDEQLRWRPFSSTFLLAAWIAVTLVVTYIGNFFLQILAPHRILLMTPAIAVLTAQGLRNLAPPARTLLVTAILVYGVTTVDDYYPKEPWDKVAENMVIYARQGELALMEIYRGDLPLAYYLDHLMPPDTETHSLRQWRDYRASDYPDGLIERITAYPTVWLMHWSPDPSAFNFLAQTGHTRTAALTTDHRGNALNVYRYDRLPADPVDQFEGGITLLHVVIHPDIARVDLWWSADSPLAVDYSFSAFLLDEAGVSVAQYDSAPFEGRHPTTTWTPGEVVYDPRPLHPVDFPPGRYQVGVQIYTWYDGARLPTADGGDWLIVGELVR